MNYLRGPNRAEVQLLPPCLDDYVAANAPVRFLDAFVEGLDLEALGFARTTPAATGRPGYHPADLLKLYLYGYFNRIRSSRRLEAEAGRNCELIWLLRAVRPDFKTIADFRKDNRDCFKKVFKQFNLLCRKLDLFGAELVAIDGSKFKAVNHPARRYTAEQFQELVQTIDKRIEEYLLKLDQQDSQAEGVAGLPNKESLQDKLALLKSQKGKLEELVQELQQSQQQSSPATDVDSRPQKRVGVGYNVQVAVDAKHHLIVEPEVVQDANDRGQLSAMALAAKQELGVDQLKAVADAGYHESHQLHRCTQEGIEAYVPAQGTTSGQSKEGKQVFPKSAFVYDPVQDAYRCPAGQHLERGCQSQDKGKTIIVYYHRKACGSCPIKSQCTVSEYRKISRGLYEAEVEQMAKRVADNRAIVARRKTIVEHVFGTLRNWGHDTFLTRGLESVRAEFSLSALSYNLRRALQLVSVERLVAMAATEPARS
jgi:transposase